MIIPAENGWPLTVQAHDGTSQPRVYLEDLSLSKALDAHPEVVRSDFALLRTRLIEARSDAQRGEGERCEQQAHKRAIGLQAFGRLDVEPEPA